MMTKRFDLSNEALDFFTNEDLFEMIMSNDYDVHAYAKGLAHVCYGNEKLSKKVCRMARDNCFEGDHPNYLIVLRHMLRYDDMDAETGESLRPKRLEWIFGTAQIKHSVKTDGSVQIGLEHLSFNINSEAVSYVTALCERENQDNVSVLKLILTSYCVQQMALDQAQAAASKSTTSGNKKESQEAPELTSSAKAAGIEQSSLIEQLRVRKIAILGQQNYWLIYCILQTSL